MVYGGEATPRPPNRYNLLHFPPPFRPGLGCATVLGGEGAALAAAKTLSLHDHLVWAKLRGRRLLTWLALKDADRKLTAEGECEKMN